jgi:hypothetical protein
MREFFSRAPPPIGITERLELVFVRVSICTSVLVEQVKTEFRLQLVAAPRLGSQICGKLRQ